jgi:hypothetical protein
MVILFGNLVLLTLLLFSCAVAQDFVSLAPAPSITPGERFDDYFHRTFGWQQMGSLAVNTGIDYAIARPEWGRGMGGFGCGYASSFGRRLVTNSAEFGAASFLKEDIRYRLSHREGVIPRLKFALTHAFVAYGPDNREEPAYARFVGITSLSLIDPAWHAGGLTAARVGKNAGFRGLDVVQQSVLDEFSPDLKRLGERILKRVLKR